MYTVVYDEDWEYFEDVVSTFMDQGWELWGHPFLYNGNTLVQVLYKKKAF